MWDYLCIFLFCWADIVQVHSSISRFYREILINYATSCDRFNENIHWLPLLLFSFNCILNKRKDYIELWSVISSYKSILYKWTRMTWHLQGFLRIIWYNRRFCWSNCHFIWWMIMYQNCKTFVDCFAKFSTNTFLLSFIAICNVTCNGTMYCIVLVNHYG